MNPVSNGFERMRRAAYVVAALGAFLLVAWLAQTMRRYGAPPPVDQQRIAERKKNLAEVKAASADVLSHYAWQDQAKGFVRVPIERAIELTLQEWQDPVAARSNLVARAEKLAEPPPKAPEKPSEFE